MQFLKERTKYESFFCKSVGRVTVAFQDEIALPKISHAAQIGQDHLFAAAPINTSKMCNRG
jgi:hypothetical protein